MMIHRQPKGLYPLFFTELWGRFGFYAVQTILVLYMSRGRGLSDDHAFLLFGTFSSMLFGVTLAESSQIYFQAFLWFGALALLLTATSLVLIPYVKRLIEPIATQNKNNEVL